MNDFEDMKENGNKFTKNLIKKLGAKEAAENETKTKKVGVKSYMHCWCYILENSKIKQLNGAYLIN